MMVSTCAGVFIRIHAGRHHCRSAASCMHLVLNPGMLHIRRVSWDVLLRTHIRRVSWDNTF